MDDHYGPWDEGDTKWCIGLIVAFVIIIIFAIIAW